MKNVAIAVVALTFAAQSISAEGPNIKGIFPGMSEQALLIVYPKAKCATATLLDDPVKFRSCKITGITVANYRASDAEVRIIDNKVMEVRLDFMGGYFDTLITAMENKFGKPEKFGDNMLEWKFPDRSEISIFKTDAILVLSITTDASRTHAKQAKERRQKAANSDL